MSDPALKNGDDEADQLLAGSAEPAFDQSEKPGGNDRLSVVKAVPKLPIQPPTLLDGNAEIDKLLGGSKAPEAAPEPRSHVIEMPVQKIEGDVPEKPEPGILERFVEGAKHAGSDAVDAVAPYGAAWGKLLNSPALGGSDVPIDDRAIQERARAAAERSPVTSGAVNMAMAIPAAETLGGAGAARAIGTGAAISAGDSAIHGGDVTDDALSALVGGATGGAFHGLGAGYNAVKNYAAEAVPSLEAAASRARVAATGIYGAGMKKLANELGDGGVTKLGNDIEAANLHEGHGILGKLFGASSDDYHQNASELADDALARHRTTAYDATNQGVQVPMGDTIDQLRGQAHTADAKWSGSGESQAKFIRNEADRIEARTGRTVDEPPVPRAPVTDADYARVQRYGADALATPGGTTTTHNAVFDDALEQRKGYDDEIKYAGRNPGARMPHEEVTNRFIANDIRAGLQNALDEQAPHLSQDWRNAQHDMNTALTVQTPSAARVYQQAGNDRISLPTMIAGAGGIASGNPLTGAAMAAASSITKGHGQSMYAGAVRGLQHGAESIAQGDPGADTLARFLQSRPAEAIAGVHGGYTAPQPVAAQNPQESAKDASAMGRGHELPGVVNNVLRDNPEMLGKYRGQFEQAGRSPSGIAMLLIKLNAKDPEWKAGIGAQLQRMTGDNQ